MDANSSIDFADNCTKLVRARMDWRAVYLVKVLPIAERDDLDDHRHYPRHLRSQETIHETG